MQKEWGPFVDEKDSHEIIERNNFSRERKKGRAILKLIFGVVVTQYLKKEKRSGTLAF